MSEEFDKEILEELNKKFPIINELNFKKVLKEAISLTKKEILKKIEEIGDITMSGSFVYNWKKLKKQIEGKNE